MSSPLAQAYVTSAWALQGILTLPLLLHNTGGVGGSGYFPPGDIYWTIWILLHGLLGAAVVLIVILQFRLPASGVAVSTKRTLLHEVLKSGIVTALWLWLLLDIILRNHSYRYPGEGNRLVWAGLSGLYPM
jgi:hypothetical protein